ncbi:MAG: alpha/beta hydrolase [Bacteroidales bacterium]|nr:alpha/beta hydrolase [Bacteroidales bacterium]
MEQHRTLDFEGHSLHYRDEGRDHEQTLVLLHGFLQSQDVWSSYTLTYMRTLRVVAIDLPGHGYSETYGDVHSMDFMARAVRAVLDEAGVEQCVMVGHSMGGYVALAFAERYPFMLRGLGLINSHAMGDSDASREWRQQACEQLHANRAGFILDFTSSLFDVSKRKFLNQDIKDLQEQCLETTEAGALAALRGMGERPSRLHVLQAIEVPVLFVYGRNDERLPLEEGVSQAMEARHAELLMLADVGHMAFLEERDYVKLRLRNFVATCYF